MTTDIHDYIRLEHLNIHDYDDYFCQPCRKKIYYPLPTQHSSIVFSPRHSRLHHALAVAGT